MLLANAAGCRTGTTASMPKLSHSHSAEKTAMGP